jgi:sugar fermentation stimulation protein A
MDLPMPLLSGRLLRRYKRFLADVAVDDGMRITAHCPNTGSLMGCAEPGLRVWLSRSDNPKRRYPLTWELVESDEGTLVGIHTGRSNRLVQEAIATGVIPELAGYASLRPEVPFGREGSRADLLLARDDSRCFVEVKNVTAAVSGGIALFPDAVTRRGAKHLRELMGCLADGDRAVLVFSVQRGDASEVRPADEIDPVYGRALRAAMETGVEVYAYRARVSPRSITLQDRIPVVCP